MTNAIKSSLSKLDSSLQGLESSVSEVAKKRSISENAPRAPQSDLFGGAPSNDAKALASRLDGAISKVEKLLKDGVAHG